MPEHMPNNSSTIETRRQIDPTHGEKRWTCTIRPVSGWFDIHLGELWRYRDLILLFVHRDFVAIYKQTILGPLWYIIQPVLTTLVLTVIFSTVAKIPTDGMPPVMFYLSGVVAWRYFADCLLKTSNTFVGNANIFGKVYFPRLTVPLSVVISNLISFVIQLLLLVCFWAYFYGTGAAIKMMPAAILMPLLVLQIAALGLGCGIIISSLTTKYRDLAQLVGFGVQLWMYATPIVYPASIIPAQWRWVMFFNPMTPVIETFRYMFTGVGTISPTSHIGSVITTSAILLVGVVLFSRIEKSFMDTV
jgi:lipopolysaccharide transport system permease protein